MACNPGCTHLSALLLAIAALLCTPAPAFAQSPAFAGQAVPHAAGRDFRLADADGRERSLADFRGKVVLLFFGFTSCPDVCPTELARLAELLRLLGERAERVQVLFITLDPERDTPALLRDYMRAFDARFLALRGDERRTAAAAEEFRVFYRRLEGSAPGRYTLEHSSYIHAIDPQGNLRLRFTGAMPVEAMLADVRRLLGGE